MPLTHVALSALCVGTAFVMVLRARDTATRLAHLAMAGVMVVLALGMHSSPLVLGGAVALVLVSLVVWRRTTQSGCALDLAACAGLVALMALRPAMPMSGMPPSPSGPTTLAAATVVAVWALARRRTPGRGRRLDAVASWLMVAAMGAMVLA